MSRFHQKLEPGQIAALALAGRRPEDKAWACQNSDVIRVLRWCSNNLVLVLEDCRYCGQGREDCNEEEPCRETLEMEYEEE
jgi:hypothetical protein